MPEEIQVEQLRYDSRKDGTNLKGATMHQRMIFTERRPLSAMSYLVGIVAGCLLALALALSL